VLKTNSQQDDATRGDKNQNMSAQLVLHFLQDENIVLVFIDGFNLFPSIY